MSAASPATAQARRAAPSPQPPARPATRAASGFSFTPAESAEELIRINLGDVPRMELTMDVEGFKPSLLSRLLALVAPLDKR